MTEKLEIRYSIFELTREGHMIVPKCMQYGCIVAKFDDEYYTEEEAGQAIMKQGSRWCSYFVIPRYRRVDVDL